MSELTFVRRTNRVGQPSVAPFIDGWNVWDIPPNEWTEAVQEAIKHAFELGWRHCNAAHAEIGNVQFPLRAEFREER